MSKGPRVKEIIVDSSFLFWVFLDFLFHNDYGNHGFIASGKTRKGQDPE